MLKDLNGLKKIVSATFLSTIKDGHNKGVVMNKIKERLEYLRGEIEAERISMGEIMELESLSEHINPGDVLLLEWAGVKET